MHINSGPSFGQPRIIPLAAFGNKVAVLRLDEVHPVIAGNKWYKLKGYISAAQAQGKKALLTFGGAYSNHIIATAAACAHLGLKSYGVIRGERAPQRSPTLQDAEGYGMELCFVSREAYRSKQLPPELEAIASECIIVPEGGYGKEGMEGFWALRNELALGDYTHILCAVGTGTTVAAFAHGAPAHQQVIGISALKNNLSLEDAVEHLLQQGQKAYVHIEHNFHFGGYAKYNKELLQFMNTWYRLTGIPSDFVYTAKLFYAFTQLWEGGFFGPQSNVLLVHSGGLQGNRSLPPGSLIF